MVFVGVVQLDVPSNQQNQVTIARRSKSNQSSRQKKGNVTKLKTHQICGKSCACARETIFFSIPSVAVSHNDNIRVVGCTSSFELENVVNSSIHGNEEYAHTECIVVQCCSDVSLQCCSDGSPKPHFLHSECSFDAGDHSLYYVVEIIHSISKASSFPTPHTEA